MAGSIFLIVCVCLLGLERTTSQLNGEFWWLNEKFSRLSNVVPPQPSIEEISELETDDSVKIIFRDANVSVEADYDTGDNNNRSDTNEKNGAEIYFKDESALATTNNFIQHSVISDKLAKFKELTESNDNKDNNTNNVVKNTDVLNFSFPEDEELVPNRYIKLKVTTEGSDTSTNDNNLKESESICTFITIYECVRRRGNPFSFNGRPIINEIDIGNNEICCILPIKTKQSSKILFPDTQLNMYNRNKRSNDRDGKASLKQREPLMRRKYPQMNSKSSSTTSRSILIPRVVTPEDYLDPYWNIKNSKFRTTPSKSSEQNYDSKYDYLRDDYDEYTSEIPKPGGLKGVSSDKGWSLIKPSGGFSYSNSDDVSEEDDGDISFGYGSIDPRKGNPIRTSASRRKPIKLKFITNKDNPNVSPVVSFHSKPDFQVLQGFKLPNLARNKRRVVRTIAQNGNKKYEDRYIESSNTVGSYDIYDYEDYIDLENQVYKDCGRVYNSFYAKGKSISEIERGNSPWLALVVLTRSRQSILCYATLLHPRAAVTAADCVCGTAAGEISLITGAFDLSEENNKSQHRLVTVVCHPQYKVGKLSNNLAVLHWKRPLVLGQNVQPACMGDPHVGDDCYFVGWAGYDAALKERPHWQQSYIVSPKICNMRLLKLDVELPTDAFCTSVDSAETVTGVGGPLICMNNNRHTIVGVAVWRDTAVLTVPVLEWTSRVIEGVIN